MTMNPPRPVGVTILVVLLWVQAILAIAVGLVLLAEHSDPDLVDHLARSSDTLLGYAIFAIAAGVVTAIVAWALGNASNFARWLIAFIAILHIAGDVYSLIAFDGVTRGSAIADAFLALVVLYFLFGERGSEEFFTS
jgi:hypothetical protein